MTMALLSMFTLSSPLVAPRAPVVTQRAAWRVVVTVYPDLSGLPVSGSCEGCDGRLTASDVLAGNAAALPGLEVVLSDGGGRELLRQSTSPQSNGRQTAIFMVEPAEGLTVSLDGLPAGWLACPGLPLSRAVSASGDGLRVDIGIWQGCPSGGYEASVDIPAAAPAMPITSTEEVLHLPTSIEIPERIGLAEGSGVVKGHVFVDPDLDGLQGVDKDALGGWPVTLEGERTSWTAWTAPDGAFGFPEVPTGSYALRLDAPTGFRILTTDRYAHVELRRGATVDLAFGVLASGSTRTETVRGETKPSPLAASSPRLPETGAQPPSHGPLFFGVAALTSFIGMFGLMLDASIARHN